MITAILEIRNSRRFSPNGEPSHYSEFCQEASTEVVRAHGPNVNPGQSIGWARPVTDGALVQWDFCDAT